MNNNLANIKKSIFFLNKNECVAIPTETVYGLAANAYSSKSVKKIYSLSIFLLLRPILFIKYILTKFK